MLNSLHIQNFAIIDQLHLEIGSNMTCLTGETGAGKSILLGALGLVLGGRADTLSVKHGQDKADISAVFDITHLPQVKNELLELDLDCNEECILRRVIKTNGGSKAYINGSPVTVNTLKRIGEQLINIHGQHSHHALTHKQTQLQRLDDFGKHHHELSQVSEAYNEWSACKKELEKLLDTQAKHDEKIAFLDFQLANFNQVQPEPNEWKIIQEEHQLQANSERILSSLSNALEDLNEKDHCVSHILNNQITELEQIAQLDPRLEASVEALKSALIDVEETSSALRQYQNSIDLDAQRLQFLDERMASLHGLAKKHNTAPEGLYELHQQLIDERSTLDNTQDNIDSLKINLEKKEKDYLDKSLKLHDIREKTSIEISKKVSASMQTLGMDGGQFKVEVDFNPKSFTEYGQDQIQFLVSANPGQPLMPLSKVASGGELSRISLAIQMITAQSEPVPTLIFDEVDSGIGGGIAEVVGRHLRELSETNEKSRQILCVTHLPQVASQAHHHLKVLKIKTKDETTTGVLALNEEDRVTEIARMLGGSTLTDATIAHAKDMLSSTR